MDEQAPVPQYVSLLRLLIVRSASKKGSKTLTHSIEPSVAQRLCCSSSSSGLEVDPVKDGGLRFEVPGLGFGSRVYGV